MSVAESSPRTWDVFLSYSRGDAHRVAPLRERLLACGLDVFVDEVAVAGFAGISDAIRDGLSRSKALLACYSAAYPERQACQWELTAAYLAGLREGDPRRRVMVVNPEPAADHIHPVELRDAKHWELPAGPAALDALVADVRAHVSALDGPIGATETAPAPYWLPGPAPSPAPAFTGRLPWLWQVHSSLHRHAAPLTTGHTTARPVQIRGAAGIGKTLLTQEYATWFAAAYPGGIHWLARDADGAHAPYDKGLRALAAAHGLSGEGAAEEVLARLHDHFAYAGEPFLWIVDDLPGGLTTQQVGRLCAPHPLGRTLLTTRSRMYDALATAVEPGPLADDAAYALLTHDVAPSGPDEEAAARALCAAVVGHPLALDLLASGAADGYTALHDRFHTPGRSLLDVLARRRALPTGYPAEVTAALVRDVPAAGPSAMDVLRLAAAFSPTPLTRDDAVRALSSAVAVPDIATARRLDAGIAELHGRSLLAPAGSGAWSVHPLILHAWLRHDPEPARAEQLRHAVLQTLRTPYGTTLERIGGRPGATGTSTREPQMRPYMPAQRDAAPSELERMAAFDLQVELATRIGVQELAPGSGSLREALGSLYAMFTFTRNTLRQYSIGLAADQPAAKGVRTVHGIAYDLLNRILRPFTSEWHPRLAAHEALRPEGASPVAHEQSWADAPALRTALAELQGPLLSVVAELAEISGADFGLPAAS